MATAKKTSAVKAPAKAPVTAAKTPAVKPAAVKKVAAKKAAAPVPVAVAVATPTAKPKAAAKPKAVKPAPTLSAEQRTNYVQVAAFYMAERRGFVAGDPTADWKAAEEEVDRLIASGHFNQGQ